MSTPVERSGRSWEVRRSALPPDGTLVTRSAGLWRLLLLLPLFIGSPSLAQSAQPPSAVTADAGSDAPDAGPATAKPDQFVQTVEPKQVTLAQPFVRTLVITHAKDERWEVRLPDDPGEFEILENQRRREDRTDSATTTYALTMSAFELGNRTLPPLTFDVSTPGGKRVFTSPPESVEVLSALPPDVDEKGASAYDLRPPEEVPIPSYTLLWAILVALVAAALGYLFYRWWKKRPAKSADAGPPLPLDVRTRNELDALARENLPAQARFKEFYIRLSEIVRGYVGARYGFDALDLTSSELLTTLADTQAPDLPREELAAFLTDADLVKFARAPSTPEDCARSLSFAYRLVDVTRPLPPPPDAQRKLP